MMNIIIMMHSTNKKLPQVTSVTLWIKNCKWRQKSRKIAEMKLGDSIMAQVELMVRQSHPYQIGNLSKCLNSVILWLLSRQAIWLISKWTLYYPNRKRLQPHRVSLEIQARSAFLRGAGKIIIFFGHNTNPWQCEFGIDTWTLTEGKIMDNRKWWMSMPTWLWIVHVKEEIYHVANHLKWNGYKSSALWATSQNLIFIA